MTRINNITIGSDPELFIINTKTKKIVSSIGLIPGSKHEPFVPEGMEKGFAIQADNVLAEFNIPPTKTKAEFVNCISKMKTFVDGFVKERNPDFGILCAASAHIDREYLDCPEAVEFGCSVDYNVYTQSANPAPKCTEDTLRSAGFHIHIGYDNPNIETSLQLIKYLDLHVGVPAILVDTDVKRRNLYGKAGCFRLTDFGLEYRVLSGKLLESKELISWVHCQVMAAIRACKNGNSLPNSSDIIQSINKNDVKHAKKVCEAYGVFMYGQEENINHFKSNKICVE